MRIQRLMVIVVLAGLAGGVYGEEPAGDAKVYAQRKEKEREWMATSAVEGYKAAGQHGAWDGDAVAALEVVLAPPTGLRWQALHDKQAELLNKAVAGGCNDPLIGYYHDVMVGEPDGVLPDGGLQGLKEHLKGVMASKYPAFWKLVVQDGYANYLENMAREDNPESIGSMMKIVDAALPLWKEALKDKDVPDDELLWIGQRLVKVHQRGGWATTDRAEYFSRYFEPWVAARPESSAAWALKCRVYCDYAQDGFLEEGRKVKVKIFGPADGEGRVAEARAAGEKAWEANPSDPLAANEMLMVALLEHSTREEMEKWYGRSNELDPGNLEASFGKAWWLLQRDSEEAGMTFARECVRTAGADSGCLFVLLRIHQERSKMAQVMSLHDLYYKNPAVFADMQLTYEKALSFEPKNREYLSWYAFYAMEAEQWGAAQTEFDLIGDHPDLKPFGSMTLYKYERRRAERKLVEGKGE